MSSAVVWLTVPVGVNVNGECVIPADMNRTRSTVSKRMFLLCFPPHSLWRLSAVP